MDGRLSLTVTRDPREMRAAQALRHRVFVGELGGDDSSGDGLERDGFDAGADHLIIRDLGRPDLGVVATLRVAEGMRYTATEFDLSELRASGRRPAEVGRACVHPEYRGGCAGLVLFRGTLAHLTRRRADLLVGTASFHGADPAPHMPALRRLRQEALAPPGFRPVARGAQAVAVDGTAPPAAMRGVPPLIRTYLRAGAWVGDGAWIDAAFNTVDVCIVLDLVGRARPARPDAGRAADRSAAPV